MVTKIIKGTVITIIVLLTNTLFAQPSYESLLKDLQKDYSFFYKMEENGTYSLSLEEKGQNIKMMLSEFDYSDNTDWKCGAVMTALAKLDDGYSPSKSLLSTIMDVNTKCAPGVVYIYDNQYIVYLSYFWKSDLTKNTLLKVIGSAVNNTLYFKDTIAEFLKNE